MKYEIKIKRQKPHDNKTYWQTFIFEGKGEETVAAVLNYLNRNDDLYDIDGNAAKRINWDCSCNQGVCGSCSMIINGRPCLACKYKIKNAKLQIVILEPLTKFRVISDLSVDRTEIYETPIIHGLFANEQNENNEKMFDIRYAASKCMKCGLCLEVCPNTGFTNNNLGAYFAVECFLKFTQTKNKSDGKVSKSEYNSHFSKGCSKSLSCQTVCPAKIDIREIINYMNRK